MLFPAGWPLFLFLFAKASLDHSTSHFTNQAALKGHWKKNHSINIPHALTYYQHSAWQKLLSLIASLSSLSLIIKAEVNLSKLESFVTGRCFTCVHYLYLCLFYQQTMPQYGSTSKLLITKAFPELFTQWHVMQKRKAILLCLFILKPRYLLKLTFSRACTERSRQLQFVSHQTEEAGTAWNGVRL